MGHSLGVVNSPFIYSHYTNIYLICSLNVNRGHRSCFQAPAKDTCSQSRGWGGGYRWCALIYRHQSRLQGTGGTYPPLLQMARHGGTVSRRIANKKLTKLYWPSRKRSPKRLIVLVEPKKWRARQKFSVRRVFPPPTTFKFLPAPLYTDLHFGFDTDFVRGPLQPYTNVVYVYLQETTRRRTWEASVFCRFCSCCTLSRSRSVSSLYAVFSGCRSIPRRRLAALLTSSVAYFWKGGGDRPLLPSHPFLYPSLPSPSLPFRCIPTLST